MATRSATWFIGTLMVLACAVGPAQADDPEDAVQFGPGYGWMGPGMMGGYDYGMGPGMMGGYHGGYGMGPGMMGGYGYGMGPFSALNLTDDQRSKINKIQDEERKQHWAVMGKMLEKQNTLRDLIEQSEPDPKKVGVAYGEIAKLRQQMLETHIQARNQMQKVLTKEQREQLEQWRHGMWGPGAGPHGGYVPGMMRP
jgi:Spy/CpxP family protein refolding chaperone